MKNIIIVTRPCKTQAEIQFAFDQLERQNMNPYWMNRLGHKDFTVARPALSDDPAEIVEREE